MPGVNWGVSSASESVFKCSGTAARVEERRTQASASSPLQQQRIRAPGDRVAPGRQGQAALRLHPNTATGSSRRAPLASSGSLSLRYLLAPSLALPSNYGGTCSWPNTWRSSGASIASGSGSSHHRETTSSGPKTARTSSMPSHSSFDPTNKRAFDEWPPRTCWGPSNCTWQQKTTAGTGGSMPFVPAMCPPRSVILSAPDGPVGPRADGAPFTRQC